MPEQDQPPRPIPASRLPVWDLIPFLIFVAINVAVCVTWYDELSLIQAHLSPLLFVLGGLATYRIAQIIANERIARIFRAPFVDVQVTEGHEEEIPKRKGLREMMGSLVYCPSCVGVWVAAALAYGLIFAPNAAWVIIVIFAFSAVERIISPLTYRMEQD